MTTIKDKLLLENMLFETIECLEKTLKLAAGRNPTLKLRYQSALAALDLLNEEYNEITGQDYISLDRVMQYNEKQWSVFS